MTKFMKVLQFLVEPDVLVFEYLTFSRLTGPFSIPIFALSVLLSRFIENRTKNTKPNTLTQFDLKLKLRYTH